MGDAGRGSRRSKKPRLSTVGSMCGVVTIVAILAGTWKAFVPPHPPFASICSASHQKTSMGYILPNVTLLNPPLPPRDSKYVGIRHGRIEFIAAESEIAEIQLENPNMTILWQYPLLDYFSAAKSI